MTCDDADTPDTPAVRLSLNGFKLIEIVYIIYEAVEVIAGFRSLIDKKT